MLRRGGLGVLPAADLPLVGEVDLLVEGVLVNEIDGYEFHREWSQFRSDRRRDRAALSLGLVSQRFAWEDAVPLRVLEESKLRLETLEGPLPFAPDVPRSMQEAVAEVLELSNSPECRVVGARLLRGKASRSVVWP